MKGNILENCVRKALAVAVGSAGLSLALPALAESGSLQDAVANGKAELTLRYRFENVDQDNNLDEANASTLKSRLTFTTADFAHLKAQVEVDNVVALGDDNYNSTANGVADHSVVADPEGTDINQAWIAYDGLDGTEIKYGRQRLLLDNQRFFGGVGWRQNEQTYDGLTLVNKSLADTTVTYAFIDNVNRIFGPDGANADLDTSINVLNVKYTGIEGATLVGYAYLMDVEDGSALSNDTYGVRLSGKAGGDTKLLYTLEYASQSEHDDDTQAAYDADYYTVEAGVEAKGITAKLGLEVLEGDADAGKGFQTPFATLHKFNGFTDQFLGTPPDGIEDLYASVSGNLAGFKLALTYHQFESEQGSSDYGDEVDLVVAKKLGKLGLLLKYADYSADDWKVDTQKLWLQASYKF